MTCDPTKTSQYTNQHILNIMTKTGGNKRNAQLIEYMKDHKETLEKELKKNKQGKDKFWFHFYEVLVDNIKESKRKIQTLMEIQDNIFSTLTDPLELREESRDYLFDFIFNDCDIPEDKFKNMIKNIDDNIGISEGSLSEEMKNLILKNLDSYEKS